MRMRPCHSDRVPLDPPHPALTTTDPPPPATLSEWRLPDVARLDDVALEQVLQHLTRVTPEGRRKAAQDPATRMYLQAGLRLLQQQVSPRRQDDEVEQVPQSHPFLSWLSRSRVAAETENEPPDSGLPRRGTQAGLRDRWEPHSNFINDLLLVALTADNWGVAITDNPEFWAALREQPDFAETIREVGYGSLVAMQQSAGFRVELLAAAISAHEEPVRRSLADCYRSVVSTRAHQYEAILSGRGLKLRPRFSYELLSEFMTALNEGLALRLIADPDAPVIDHERRSSLLGLGALAILLAGVDLHDDGLGVDEYLRSVFSPPAS